MYLANSMILGGDYETINCFLFYTLLAQMKEGGNNHIILRL